MTEDIEYRGLVAEAWDLLRGDYSNWPDRPFYRAIIERQGGRALDVGCGTGRLLLDYLAAGLDVDGVDNSPDMLAICRQKAAALDLDLAGRLFQQSMDGLDLPGRYGTILVPSSSFQLLTDVDSANAALRCFRRHLAPQGVLVMSIMSKLWPGKTPPEHMQWSDWRKIGERQRPEDGVTVRRWIRARYDHEQQLEHEENRYELVDEAGNVLRAEEHRRSPAVRWYTQAQIVDAVARAGFADVRLTSGFTEANADEADTTFCVIGRRPAV